MLAIITLCAALFALCLSEKEQLWYDPMDNFAAHWIATGAKITQITNSKSSCISSNTCVRVGGHNNNADDWIIRQTALPILSNFNSYTSFLLKYDVFLSSMESSDNCIISYKYDTETGYTTIRSYSRSAGTKYYAQTASIPKTANDGAEVLYIKLETDGFSFLFFLP